VGAHARLVDEAHVENLEPELMHEALLAEIDAADADLPDLGRLHRRRLPRNLDQLLRPVPEENGNRHAVYVAARRQDVRVGVSVSVEPEHAEPRPMCARERPPPQSSDGEAVIPAKDHRQAPRVEFARDRRRRPSGSRRRPAAGGDSRRRWEPRVAGALQVAAVCDLDALGLEHRLQLRDPERLGAHRCTAFAGTDVRRRADDRDFLHGFRDCIFLVQASK
jgi:hypothetical protein